VGCQTGTPPFNIAKGEWQVVKFLVEPKLPAGADPVKYTVLVGIPKSKDDDALPAAALATAQRWICPMFIYVTGKEGQAETADISVSAEGTTFYKYFPTENDLTVFHYAHNLHAAPPGKTRQVSIKTKSSVPQVVKVLDETALINLHRSSSGDPWKFVDDDKIPFVEQFDSADPSKVQFSGAKLDSTRKSWIEKMHNIAESVGVRPD